MLHNDQLWRSLMLLNKMQTEIVQLKTQPITPSAPLIKPS